MSCPLFLILAAHPVRRGGSRASGARRLVVTDYNITRFVDLRGTIPEISDRMLSERLKEMETAGLVERRVIPETPVRIEYRLTSEGLALAPVMEAILVWAAEWLPRS